MSLPDPLSCYARADLILGLAAAFSRPDATRAARVRALGEQAEELLGFAALGDPALPRALEALADATRTTSLDAWTTEHARLFEAGMVCPANETAFVRRDKGVLIGDVAGFYRAFGVEPKEGSGEKQDHLVAELEFVGLLLVMLGHASRDARQEEAEVALQALRAFADDHLGEWLPAFCLALSSATPLELYQAAAEALARSWEGVRQAYACAVPGGRPLPVIEEESGSPYECGMAQTGTL